jgi:uncharacterized glyoxalase superfamily protein PhnB
VLESVSPVFQVADFAKVLDFYQKVLAFEIAWQWGESATHAAVCRDKVEIMLERAEDGSASSAYFVMTGIDDFHARVVQAGGNVTVPLEDRPYGMRDFRVVDPAGNQLSFGEAIATGGKK